MFTGLVEHLGVISSITPSTSFEGFTFTISQSAPILDDCQIGDSICCAGACLTVTSFDKEENGGWFTVGLANETLEKTNLGQCKVGDLLDLERAMSGSTRFGGHMVQGHVETTATIKSKIPDGNSIRYTFALPPASPPAANSFMPYIIHKGFICIDGASLTITNVDYSFSPSSGGEFSIMLIAHSQSKLTLTAKEVGDTVNIETDCVGKYMLGPNAGEKKMVDEATVKELVEQEVEKRMKVLEDTLWRRMQAEFGKK